MFTIRRLFGCIDSPARGQVFQRYQGLITLQGWVLARNRGGIEIVIELDGRPVEAEIVRVPRPDVSHAYPKLAAWNATPGFIARLDVGDLGAGRHELACKAGQGGRVLRIDRVGITTSPANEDLQGPAILHMHIPKTAGTSLNRFLCTRFPGTRSACHIESRILDVAQPDLEPFKGKRFLSGHLHVDMLRRMFDFERYFTITLLRNPVRQTISHLAWVRRLAEPEHHRELDGMPDYIKAAVERLSSLDIVQFIDTMGGRERTLFDNCQTRYLLAVAGNPELTDRLLQGALLRLTAFDLVGLTERYDDTLLLLAFLMGWQPPRSSPVLNVSEPRFIAGIDIEDEEVKRSLGRLTRFDMALYQHGLQLFSKQIRSMWMILRAELSGLDDQAYPDMEACRRRGLIEILSQRAERLAARQGAAASARRAISRVMPRNSTW